MFFFTTSSKSEVVINGTRIIYKSNEKETVLQLKNKGKNPYLLQFWLDTGDANSKPGSEKLPFIITPPVVRIDPDKGQAVRILGMNPTFPNDRETLLWFNMLEIPPSAEKIIESGKNTLQLAFRSRLKFFYRPSGLPMSSLDSYTKVKFYIKGYNLKIVNNSPYYITFKDIQIFDDNGRLLLSKVATFTRRMISPNSEMDLKLTQKDSSDFNGKKVSYTVINDYGGESNYKKVLLANE